MKSLHTVATLVAFMLALAGCLLTDDVAVQLAMVAGAAAVAVVLDDLQRYPHRPMHRAAEPGEELSP